MKRKLRIGIMGCADIARRLVIPAMQELTDEYEITGIASRDGKKAAEFATLFNIKPVVGYDKLLETDADIIYMPLPTGLHEEWVLRCLEAGKHVYVEKSLALNLDSAERMSSLAEQKNLLLAENFMFRYHSQHAFVSSLIEKGMLGELRLFRSSFGFPPLPENNFRYDPLIGGGALLDAGAYTVQAAQLFLGEALQVNTATLYIQKEMGSDIGGNMTLINPDGLVAQLAFGFDNFYQCNYELWGSNGKIVAEKAFTPKPDEKPVISVFNNDGNFRHEAAPDNHFKKILTGIYESILSEDFSQHRKAAVNQARILNDIKEKATYIQT